MNSKIGSVCSWSYIAQRGLAHANFCRLFGFIEAVDAGCGDGDELDYDPISGGHDELLADYVEHFHLGSKWIRAPAVRIHLRPMHVCFSSLLQ